MKDLLRRFGPSGLVLSVAVWCCWQHLAADEQLELDLGGPKLLRTNKARLQIELPPRPNRNPFEVVVAKEEPEDIPLESSPEEIEVAKVSSEPSLRDWQAVARQFRLRATVVSARRQCAMIDGRIYALGEQVTLALASEPFCVLASVQRDRVVLQAGEDTVELTYRDDEPKESENEPEAAAAEALEPDRKDMPAGSDKNPPVGTELLEQRMGNVQIGGATIAAIEPASAPTSGDQ